MTHPLNSATARSLKQIKEKSRIPVLETGGNSHQTKTVKTTTDRASRTTLSNPPEKTFRGAHTAAWASCDFLISVDHSKSEAVESIVVWKTSSGPERRGRKTHPRPSDREFAKEWEGGGTTRTNIKTLIKLSRGKNLTGKNTSEGTSWAGKSGRGKEERAKVDIAWLTNREGGGGKNFCSGFPNGNLDGRLAG